MNRLVAAVAFVALVGLVGTVQAQDKADPTGTWKWTISFGGQDREQTVKLKLEGDKLTGTYVGQNSETAIQDGKFNKGEISFTVIRERNGQKTTSKYKGKLTGDTIKGTAESDRGGQNQTREWEAKRSKG